MEENEASMQHEAEHRTIERALEDAKTKCDAHSPHHVCGLAKDHDVATEPHLCECGLLVDPFDPEAMRSTVTIRYTDNTEEILDWVVAWRYVQPSAYGPGAYEFSIHTGWLSERETMTIPTANVKTLGVVTHNDRTIVPVRPSASTESMFGDDAMAAFLGELKGMAKEAGLDEQDIRILKFGQLPDEEERAIMERWNDEGLTEL